MNTPQKVVLNESELLVLTSQGDRAAFTQLYNRYLKNIYDYIYHITFSQDTSEDIVQELFVKLWQNRETLTQVDSIKPYLYRSAKNMLLNHIKKEKSELKVIDVIQLKKDNAVNNTFNELIYRDYFRIAQHAIDSLPEKRRIIFKLRLNDDLSLDEIAQKLCISKSVVKKQLYAGISFVRKYLYLHGDMAIIFFCLFAAMR